MALMVKKKKAGKVKPKIRWWKLKETNCQKAFREEVIRILGGKDELHDEWDKTAKMLRKTAETVLGKRKKGRPKKRFLDVVKEDMGEVNTRQKGIEDRRCGAASYAMATSD